MRSDQARLAVAGLRIVLTGSNVDVVDDVSFTVGAGEVLGLVGESGSGKTTVALALLGYTRRGLAMAGGSVKLEGRDLLAMSPSQLRRIRGRNVAYVPQNPSSALNPALKVGSQLRDVLASHLRDDLNVSDPAVRLTQVLAEVSLEQTKEVLNAYPHQLSGGQQQRIALAMAFVCRPELIVLDEPTTGLDVTTQRQVLDTVRELCSSYGVAAVYVTHDLALVAEVADRVAVMYAGQLVELGPTRPVFTSPAHPYTAGLLQAVPSPEQSHVLVGIEGQPPRPGQRPGDCFFRPRCTLISPGYCTGPRLLAEVSGPLHLARCQLAGEAGGSRLGLLPPEPEQVSTEVRGATEVRGGTETVLRVMGVSARYGYKEVLHDVELTVDREQCVAVVGESGSGKTTLARCIAGLHADRSGSVAFREQQLGSRAKGRPLAALRAMQFVFQNPDTSLNPRRTIGQLVEQPLTHFFKLSAKEREERVIATLEATALGGDILDLYPEQLSGGERQRVAIARVLVVEPELIVCDEITSALDVSVQAAIVELLRRLQKERGLSLVFITHNLALVRSIAQKVVVLHEGHVVETGPTDRVLDHPEADYTARLLEDVPKLSSFGTYSMPSSQGLNA